MRGRLPWGTGRAARPPAVVFPPVPPFRGAPQTRQAPGGKPLRGGPPTGAGRLGGRARGSRRRACGHALCTKAASERFHCRPRLRARPRLVPKGESRKKLHRCATAQAPPCSLRGERECLTKLGVNLELSARRRRSRSRLAVAIPLARESEFASDNCGQLKKKVDKEEARYGSGAARRGRGENERAPTFRRRESENGSRISFMSDELTRGRPAAWQIFFRRSILAPPLFSLAAQPRAS